MIRKQSTDTFKYSFDFKLALFLMIIKHILYEVYCFNFSLNDFSLMKFQNKCIFVL